MSRLISYFLSTDPVVGRGHASLSDTINRGLRQLLTLCGFNPDLDFTGFSPVFHVSAYGAVGNGTTDDTVAVQAAIDAANAAGGGVVQLLGKHLVTQIIPKSGVTIKGVPDKRQFFYYSYLLQDPTSTVPVIFSDYLTGTYNVNYTDADRLIGFNMKDVAVKTQNAAAVNPAVQLRFAMKSSWRNVYIQAASTAQTVLELADYWDSQFDFVHCQEGGWSLRIVNRGDIDNCNNLEFNHPHLESGRLGAWDCQGGVAGNTKNNKIEFKTPKFEAHPSASGIAVGRVARSTKRGHLRWILGYSHGDSPGYHAAH
jgi:hypothetical protein